MKKTISHLLTPIVLVGVLLLSAAGCGSKPTQIGNVVVTTEINQDNSPIGTSQLNVVNSVPAIYLSVEVVNGREGDQVAIEWRYLTGNKVLGTEQFFGGRTDDKPQEFATGIAPTTSWVYSRINLSGLSWPLGSYETIISLNGKEVKRVDFNIVGAQDYDELLKKALVENLYLGSQINDQGQITIPSSQFSRSEPQIYAAVLLKAAPAGTKVRATWKQLESAKVINDYLTSFSGSGYLPFNISLSDFGRLWPDRLWPVGAYSISIYVDNVPVTTKNFSVS